jgi:N-dimethylarginine dimethylaminohydrolase
MLNEYSVIKRLAVRSPEQAFGNQEFIAGQWRDLNYHAEPEFEQAVREHQKLVEVLKGVGAEVIGLTAMAPMQLDSIYVRDSLIETPQGIVKAAMGKDQRAREPEANAAMLSDAGVAVIGEITSPGQVEGGDLVWLDDQTLLAAIGYRSNVEGITQLQEIVGADVTIHAFDMPHYKGAGDVFHLMSVLSPVDEKLAVVYQPLMPVRLVQLLQAGGFSFVDVPDEEFESMGCNVLAIAPSHVVMVAGNPETEKRLKAAGCKVEVIKADEISRKGEGGPTCLTRPLLRG